MHPTLISTTIHTRLGPMLAVAAPHALCLLEFHERAILDAQIARLSRGTTISPGSSPLLEQLQREIDEYFTGKRQDFNIPLRCPSTAFQQAAWDALRQIPYGQTRTYRQIAQQLGSPNAARAVGAANGRNPIAILVPCHRLVSTAGSLTGYGGGLWRKQHLLDLEKGNLSTLP